MKSSNIGLWIAGAAIAWCAWILLDMAEPLSSQGTSYSTLSEVKNSSVPVLVEFYADWCGPCRTVGPVVEELSHEVAGRAKVVRLDVDVESDLAASHGIRSIPTFIAFKNGREVARESGAISKARMLQMLGL
ncbi:MAG: thioredoxin [Verrucomicrobiota bacterium]